MASSNNSVTPGTPMQQIHFFAVINSEGVTCLSYCRPNSNPIYVSQ